MRLLPALFVAGFALQGAAALPSRVAKSSSISRSEGQRDAFIKRLSNDLFEHAQEKPWGSRNEVEKRYTPTDEDKLAGSWQLDKQSGTFYNTMSKAWYDPKTDKVFDPETQQWNALPDSAPPLETSPTSKSDNEGSPTVSSPPQKATFSENWPGLNAQGGKADLLVPIVTKTAHIQGSGDTSYIIPAINDIQEDLFRLAQAIRPNEHNWGNIEPWQPTEADKKALNDYEKSNPRVPGMQSVYIKEFWKDEWESDTMHCVKNLERVLEIKWRQKFGEEVNQKVFQTWLMLWDQFGSYEYRALYYIKPKWAMEYLDGRDARQHGGGQERSTYHKQLDDWCYGSGTCLD